MTREEREDAIFAALERAAGAGEPCPSAAELMEIAAITSASTVTYLLATLERGGRIRVDRRSNSRRVTIAATGLSTEWSARTYTSTAVAPTDARGAASPSATMSATRAAERLAEKHNLAERIERDQAAIRREREAWLDEEQRRYRLPRRGRLIDGMVA